MRNVQKRKHHFRNHLMNRLLRDGMDVVQIDWITDDLEIVSSDGMTNALDKDFRLPCFEERLHKLW